MDMPVYKRALYLRHKICSSSVSSSIYAYSLLAQGKAGKVISNCSCSSVLQVSLWNWCKCLKRRKSTHVRIHAQDMVVNMRALLRCHTLFSKQVYSFALHGH